MYIIMYYTASYWPDMHTPVLSVVVVNAKDLSIGCHGASLFSSSRKNVTSDSEPQTPISKMLDWSVKLGSVPVKGVLQGRLRDMAEPFEDESSLGSVLILAWPPRAL